MHQVRLAFLAAAHGRCQNCHLTLLRADAAAILRFPMPDIPFLTPIPVNNLAKWTDNSRCIDCDGLLRFGV